MVNYVEISDLNIDQVKIIEENRWCIFTNCIEDDDQYWCKGIHWVNRIGYLILSENVSIANIDSYEELNKIAVYNSDFDKTVTEKLSPLKDKCYLFLVKNPAYYYCEQIWTNRGLEAAKELAKIRFKFEHTFCESKDYAQMSKLINSHNSKVQIDTEKALEILRVNGYKVVSEQFAAIKL